MWGIRYSCKNRACVVLLYAMGPVLKKKRMLCFCFEKTMWQYGYVQARSTELAERTTPNPKQSLQDGRLMFGSSLSELKFLESPV